MKVHHAPGGKTSVNVFADEEPKTMWPSQSAGGRRKAQSSAPEEKQIVWPSDSSAQYDNNCLKGQMNKTKQDRP